MRSYNYLLFFVAHDLHRSRRFPSHFTCLSDNMFGLIAGSDIQRIPSAGTPLIYLIYPVELNTGNRSLTDIHEILAACEQLTNAVRTVTSLDLSHAQKYDCSMPSFSNPMPAVLSSKNQSMRTRYSVILATFANIL